jgi:hypothetical protein
MTKTKPKPVRKHNITPDADLAQLMADILEEEAGIAAAAEETRQAPPRLPPVILAPERQNTHPGADRVIGAARIRVEAEANKLLNRPDHAVQAELAHAEKLEIGAMAALGPEAFPQGAGGELVPQGNAYIATAPYIDTVKNPSMVTAEASRARQDLANNAGVLSETLDLCETIGARDNTERNLAAQMAIAHKVAMLSGRQACECLEFGRGALDPRHREQYSIQGQRYTNTMARASAEYQNAMLTVQKLRSGGKQNITVTHIQNTQVNDGGKAVVTTGVGGAASHGGDK